MARYRIKRQAQIGEEAVLEVEIPAFLTSDSDKTFYLTKMAEGDTTLEWKEVARGWNHHYTVMEDPDAKLPKSEAESITAEDTLEAYKRENVFYRQYWGFRFW